MAGEHKVILPIQARVLLNKKKPIEKPIKRTKTKPAAANKHAPLDPIDSRREEDEEADLAIATKVSATASVRQRVHKGMPGGELISFTDDEEEHPPAELIYSSDEEEAYVIPSWRAPSSLAAIDKSSSETEEPYQCFAKLKRCYEEVGLFILCHNQVTYPQPTAESLLRSMQIFRTFPMVFSGSWRSALQQVILTSSSFFTKLFMTWFDFPRYFRFQESRKGPPRRPHQLGGCLEDVWEAFAQHLRRVRPSGYSIPVSVQNHEFSGHLLQTSVDVFND
jgi:hypothetical protein